MVQRTAACLVTGNFITTSVITTMFKDLQWSILQESRRKAKIIMLDRIVYYLSEIPSQTYLVPSLASLTKRGHGIRFLHHYSRIQSPTVLLPKGNTIIKQLSILYCQFLYSEWIQGQHQIHQNDFNTTVFIVNSAKDVFMNCI